MPLAALQNVVTETVASIWPYVAPLLGGVVGFLASEWKDGRSHGRARELERAQHLRDHAIAAHERMLEALYLAEGTFDDARIATALAAVRLHSTDKAPDLAWKAIAVYGNARKRADKAERERLRLEAQKAAEEYVKVAREQIGRLRSE